MQGHRSKHTQPQKRGNEKSINITGDVTEAVQKLKEKITTTPILAHPDWQSQEPFKLKTDFSCNALGAKITQMQKDENGRMQERVILFDSKKTTATESRYQSNKGELLAFIFFCNKHKFLLYPRKFVFVTDHSALKSIKTMKFPRSLSLRWLDIVSNFNFSVEHRKAALHQDVDFLSRHVARGTATKKDGNDTLTKEEDDGEETNALVIHEIATATSTTPAETRYAKAITAE